MDAPRHQHDVVPRNRICSMACRLFDPHQVEEKRKSIRKSTRYGYRDYSAHWDGQQKRSLAVLDVVAECLDNQIAGPKYGFSPSSSMAAIYQCEVLVFELNQVRQEYRSALNASLPRGVFTTIIALMVAILYTFACRAAAMGSFDATQKFMSETVVRVLFSLTATSFFAILQVLSDLADTYTGANEQFRVDARILDGATFGTVWKSTHAVEQAPRRWRGDHRHTGSE